MVCDGISLSLFFHIVIYSMCVYSYESSNRHDNILYVCISEHMCALLLSICSIHYSELRRRIKKKTVVISLTISPVSVFQNKWTLIDVVNKQEEKKLYREFVVQNNEKKSNWLEMRRFYNPVTLRLFNLWIASKNRTLGACVYFFFFTLFIKKLIFT